MPGQSAKCRPSVEISSRWWRAPMKRANSGVAIQVQVQHHRRVIRGSPGCRRTCAVESQGHQDQLMKTSTIRTVLSSAMKSSKHSGSKANWCRSCPSINLGIHDLHAVMCTQTMGQVAANQRVFTQPPAVADVPCFSASGGSPPQTGSSRSMLRSFCRGGISELSPPRQWRHSNPPLERPSERALL